MPFLGTIVNFLAVLVCGLLGVLIKKGVPEKISNALKSAMAICVVYIGISGMLEVAPQVSDDPHFSNGLIKILVMVISMGLGALLGELIDIDKWVNRLGDSLEKRFVKKGEKYWRVLCPEILGRCGLPLLERTVSGNTGIHPSYAGTHRQYCSDCQLGRGDSRRLCRPFPHHQYGNVRFNHPHLRSQLRFPLAAHLQTAL